MVLFVQLTFSAKALEQTFGRLEYGKERGVSYLPLSHIAAQVCAHVNPTASAHMKFSHSYVHVLHKDKPMSVAILWMVHYTKTNHITTS